MRPAWPCSANLTVAEAMADPDRPPRGTMATVEDAGRSFLVPNPPFKFADGSGGRAARGSAAGADREPV